MEFREILKTERLKKGWSLKTMGEKLNKSPNSIWHYENGTRTIDSDTLLQISKIFGYEWIKKTNPDEEKEVESIVNENIRLYTENQFDKYCKMMWHMANEDDILRNLAIQCGIKNWIQDNNISKEALVQMDNRIEKENREAVESGKWFERAEILRYKYGLPYDLSDIEEEMTFEEFAEKENELMSEYNRLDDLIEKCISEGQILKVSDYEFRQRKVEEELNNLYEKMGL